MLSADKSGKDAEREQLPACLDHRRADASLDRLGGSSQAPIPIAAGLRRRGIGFRSLHESLDTTTPGGRLVFHVFAAPAAFLEYVLPEPGRASPIR